MRAMTGTIETYAITDVRRTILDTVEIVADRDALGPGDIRADPAVVLETLQKVMQSLAPDLLEHGRRTARFAVALGEAVDMPQSTSPTLFFAGLFHDLGTLALPVRLRHTKEPLSEEEYARVQSHPRAGAALLEPFPFLRETAVLIAHHHERWDGYGYPYGLRGELIPLGSRILSVADTFDALLTTTAVGCPGDLYTAIASIELLAGLQLDPTLVRTFIPLVSNGRLESSRTQGSAEPQSSLEWRCALHSIGWEALFPPPVPLTHLFPPPRPDRTLADANSTEVGCAPLSAPRHQDDDGIYSEGIESQPQK